MKKKYSIYLITLIYLPYIFYAITAFPKNNTPAQKLSVRNMSGSKAQFNIQQVFTCGKKKTSGKKLNLKIFDGTIETHSFSIPQKYKNCTVSYEVKLTLPQWQATQEATDPLTYTLSQIDDFQYQIYHNRAGENPLQAVPWSKVRQGVRVEGIKSSF